MEKYTINDFNKQFPTDDACLEWLKVYLYPDGISCKYCGKITGHSKLSKLPVYSCNRCGSHTHPMSGTIFEHSRTPLKQWFYAIFLMSATRCGISAKQLQRELGVTYKTAWRMFQEVRTLMQSTPHTVSGEVEVDECYIGGRRPGKRGRGAAGKTPVFGIVQRQGDLDAMTMGDLKASTVYPVIKERILPDSIIYTDEYSMYDRLEGHGYSHKRVHHNAKIWVLGDAHTNTIEGFWSLLKRGINGVYHAVSQKYLQSYIDEYAFRYNHRKDERPMFLTILAKV
jgi:transposase-like protein